MGPEEEWIVACEVALGRRVTAGHPVTGGDINEAWQLRLDDGERVLIKLNHRAPPKMFASEAAGLEFLREGLDSTFGLVVPQVIHVASNFLVLEFLEKVEVEDEGNARKRGAKFGIALAALHQSSPGRWGASSANFIGTLGQLNESRETWVEFFVEQRLEVQLSLPGATRLLNPGVRRGFERLIEELPFRLEQEEAPARLHGDLWAGNYFHTAKGAAIFDPAAYGGHREVDLAMMRLFGGFGEEVFDAYRSAYPLSPGFEERLKIYQLYPLLVHVNLFGASYVAAVEDSLRSLI